jgi:hypothetical protein
MPDVLYGTTSCPQINAHIGGDPVLCGQTAQVYTTDTSGEFKSVCPLGHEHVFDSRYESENVTPQ